MGANHEGGSVPPTSLAHCIGTTVVVRKIAFIPNDKEDAITTRAEFGPGENGGDVRLKPLIDLLECAAVGVVVDVGSNPGVVDRAVLRKVGCHLRERNTVRVLAGSGEDVRKVDEWIASAIVKVIRAGESLKARIRQVLLIGAPRVALLE